MNFSRDTVDAAPPSARALVALARDGSRSEWSFGEVAEASARAAGALAARGVQRGDVVMTLIGNRPEWVLTMLACFRIGAVVLPCTEQLRAADLRTRLDVARPRLIVCDERNAGVLGEAAPDADVLLVPGPELTAAEPHPPVELEPEDPCLVTFTSGTSGEPKAVLHGQRYLTGQHVQAEHWLAPQPGRLTWCTAASGWSKSARNVFIAPVAARRGGAAARRALRPARAAGHPRARAGRHALHGADGVPGDRQAGHAAAVRGPARARRGRRGAQPRGAARLARGDRAVDPRRLRPDRDRPAHRHAARRGRRARARWGARCPASRSTSTTASSSPTPRPCRPSSSATSTARRRRPARGGPATASAATTRASSTSRAGSTT